MVCVGLESPFCVAACSVKSILSPGFDHCAEPAVSQRASITRDAQ